MGSSRCVRPRRATQDTWVVKLREDRILLSPSDVTAYLGCEHATTLGFELAEEA